MATIHRLQLNEVEAITRYRDIIEEELGQEVIDYGDEPGLRALHVVARAGELELALALIRKRANVNFCTTKGLSPLHYAVLSGKPAMIRLLLRFGARVNARSERDGRTPLFSAAEKGCTEIVKVLLEAGANINIPDQSDTTPSEIAACRGYDEVATLLADHDHDYDGEAAATAGPNPLFQLMNHSHDPPPSGPSPAHIPTAPSLSALTLSPSMLLANVAPVLPPYRPAGRGGPGAFSEPPPSYEEVMSSDSLFGCTAYSQSAEDLDTEALLGTE